MTPGMEKPQVQAPAAADHSLHAEQVRLLYRFSPVGYLASLLVVLLTIAPVKWLGIRSFDNAKPRDPHFYDDPLRARAWGAHQNGIETFPFFAVAVYPAPIGSTVGLRIDENANVLDEQRRPIGGLYACGNDMASITGGVYPGPGSTIGPGMVFAYRAVMHLAGASDAVRADVVGAQPAAVPATQR